ncbi:hypothetical protein BGX34_001640 [Mortierella sp. NVP85]|nr:hypothetical protein BGX34_001640 [Mortierella sp. NVP85]
MTKHQRHPSGSTRGHYYHHFDIMRRKPNTPLPPPVFSLTLSSDESEGQEEEDEKEEDEGEDEEDDEEDNEEDNEEDGEEELEEEEGDEGDEDGGNEDNEVGDSTEDDTSPLSDQDDPPEHSPLNNRQGLRVKYVDRNQDEPDSESETGSMSDSGSILESEPVSALEEALRSEAFHPECETDHAEVVDANSDSDGNNDSVDDGGTPDQEDEAGDFEPTTSSKTLMDLREASLDRLAQAWLDICIRYGKDAADLPPDDEVDLATGQIIVDNGFLRSRSTALFGTLTWLGEDHEESLSRIENEGHRGAKRKRPHPNLKSNKQGDDMDEMYIQEEQSSQNQRPEIDDDDIGTSRKRMCYESDASEDLPSIPRRSPDIMSGWPNQSRRQEYPHNESMERYQDTSRLSWELPRRHDLWRRDRIVFGDKPRDRNTYQGHQREIDGDIAEPLNGDVYNSQSGSPPLSFVNLASDNDADDEEEGREEPHPTDIGEESSGTCSSAEDDDKENACLDTTDDNADANWPWEDEKENCFKEDDYEQNGDPTAAVKVESPFSIPWRQPTARLYSNKQPVVFDEAGVRHSQETEEGNEEDEDNDKENVYCLEAVDSDPFNSSVKKLEPKAKALLETLRAKTLSVPSLANTSMAPSITSTFSSQQSSSRQRRETLAFNLSPSDADELEDFEDYFL